MHSLFKEAKVRQLQRMVAPSSSLISAPQRDDFERFGYCVIPALYAAEEIKEIETFFEGYKRNGQAVYDENMRFEEMDKTKQQVRAMHPHRYSKQVEGWGLNTRVIDVLAVLLGRSPLLAQTMYYFKPPGAKGQGMHQDNFYLLAKPASCIAAWTAIDDATLERGCLQVVPGSQHDDIHCPSGDEGSWQHYGDSHIRPFPAEAKPVPLEVPRGSTVFFGGHLIHGSGPNRSATHSRRTFISHYVDDAVGQVAEFFHPLLNREGKVVSGVGAPNDGGPCGDGWRGAAH